MGVSVRWNDKVKVSFLWGPAPTGGDARGCVQHISGAFEFDCFDLTFDLLLRGSYRMDILVASRPTDDPR